MSARRQHGPEVGRGRDDLGLGGLTRGLHKIRKPVIAAIDGWALAAGLELALACDLRIASDRAMFGSLEVRRGFHHGDGGIVQLVNTCGVGVAMQLVLAAEPTDAHRAMQCNLVMKVVPHCQIAASSRPYLAKALPSRVSSCDATAVKSAMVRLGSRARAHSITW